MALTRKMLKAMSIDDEKIDQIIEAHSETVDALKEQRDTLKSKADKAETLQNDLDAARAALDDKGEDAYKAKYDELMEEFNSYKSGVEAKEVHQNKADAYRKLLKANGVDEKRLDSVLKVSNIDDLELDENGAFKNADALSESIKTEWSDFIATVGATGSTVPEPPNNGGTDNDQIADFRKAIGLDS